MKTCPECNYLVRDDHGYALHKEDCSKGESPENKEIIIKKFQVSVVRVSREHDTLEVEAETELEAIQMVQDGEYHHVHDWEHLETVALEVSITN